MLGIDTNVLVRLLVEDHAEQTRRARRLVEAAAEAGEPVVVSLLVLVETEWVLRSRYELGKYDVQNGFRRLLEVPSFRFEGEAAVEEALYLWNESACGFADCLIAAHHRRMGCRATATFDRAAMRLPGLIPV
jgi:predicted nucleic-acid-binding protein